MPSFLYTSVLILLIKYVSMQDIVSCGGFVKVQSGQNAPQLDLTQVKIKLMSSDGLVKYTTEPAPNGYYMIPVYEKGNYQIQIQPKAGWNFAPNKPVNLDLEACERNEDIDFDFTGFEVYGKVNNAGTSYGPSDITVTLQAGDKQLQKVKTIDGRFQFVGVLPGDYILRANHGSLQFSKAEISVKVKDDAVEVKEPLTIHGYSVSGSISNEGQAVKGVSFILMSTSDQKTDVKGCTAGSPPRFNQKGAICYVTSDEAGKFVFQSVPVGKYIIVPFHRGERTVFEVLPNQLPVDVSHSNVIIKESFTISGFGVSGQIKYSNEGKGVIGAIVKLDGKQVAKTDSQGLYAVDGMKTGTYTISVEAPSLHFDDLKVKVLPSDPLLPRIIPSSFDLCGKIMVEDKKVGDISVSVADVKQQEKGQIVAVDSNGLFCLAVKPASYIVKPITDKVALTPSSIKVQVNDSPVIGDSVKFSLFKAVLSGKVRCLSSCGEMEVMITSHDGHTSPKTQKVTSTSTSVAFVFQGVVPGDYTLSAVRPSWCWVDNSVRVKVHDSDADGFVLEQKGYSATVESSHALDIQCAKKPSSSDETVKDSDGNKFTLSPGTNEICIPSSGKFEIIPLSCHVFDKPSYNIDTSDVKEVIHLKVVKHKVSFVLTSEQAVQDVSLNLRIGEEAVEVKLPPTQAKDSKHVSKLDKEFDASVKAISVIPSSGRVLFEHAEYKATINEEKCPAAVVDIQAYRGVFVEGSVSPPIAGLEIKVTHGDALTVNGTTDQQGKYRFGPLPADIEYSVSAEKAGYIVDRDEKDPRNFKVFKLAEVSVRVEGAHGDGLNGVILSLSAQSYRSNNRTDENGHFSFIGLSPGTYYLKAILKEYEFSPLSVEVKEGITEEILVVGKRVAYSCMGSVVNLKGEAVGHKVLVKAQGVKGEDCINTEESSQTQTDGNFRVRGLKPGCSYTIKLAVDSSVNSPATIYRVSPQSMSIDMEGSDVNVGKFTVAEGLAVTDLTVFLEAPSQHLSSLKVILSKEGSMTPVQTISAASSKVIFFNSLPMDSTRYRVVLESSLSKKFYDYELTEDIVTADGPSKALTISFSPKIRTKLDYEVKESSLLALVMVVLTTLVVINKQMCQEMLFKVVNMINNKQR